MGLFWMHYSFQEYLSAWFICNKFKGNLVEQLKECLEWEHRNVFFGFVCGIGGKAVDCATKWYPGKVKVDCRLGELKDPGPLLWLEEGGKKFEEVVANLWTDLFLNLGGKMLKAAGSEGCLNVLKFLLGQKLVSAADKDFCLTALSHRVCKGYWEVVKCLIEHGADVNAADKDGRTALLDASERGHFEVVKYLIERGADVNAADEYGYTALLDASEKGHFEVVKYLIEGGVDVNVTSVDGSTAVWFACWRGHFEIVKFLIQNGFRKDVNFCGKGGRTALWYASQNGNLDAVALLIGLGANVGGAALSVATQNGHLEVVKCLIENDAKLVVGAEKLNAWHFAKWIEREDLSSLIEAKFGQQQDAKNELWKSRNLFCTFKLTGKSNAFQTVWKCVTCHVKICFWCKVNCYQGHEVEFMGFEDAHCESK